MVLGMLFKNFKNYYISRYDIYDFLKVSEGPDRPVWCMDAWQQKWRPLFKIQVKRKAPQ